jgi:hypothetical protein
LPVGKRGEVSRHDNTVIRELAEDDHRFRATRSRLNSDRFSPLIDRGSKRARQAIKRRTPEPPAGSYNQVRTACPPRVRIPCDPRPRQTRALP